MKSAEVRLLPNGNVLVRFEFNVGSLMGRKNLLADGTGGNAPATAMVKMLARARRWASLLESGEYPNRHRLAKAIGMDSAYLGRVLRLAYVSPFVVAALLDGHPPAGLSLQRLMSLDTEIWQKQHELLGMDA